MTDILPPALNLPNRATDITAVEHGAVIVIGFQIPKTTTEGMLVRHIPVIDLRIGPAPANLNDAEAWFEHATKLASNGTHVETPAAPWVNQTLAVGIRLLNDRGRDAGLPPLVTLTVRPSPSAPVDLTAVSQPSGVALKWKSAAAKFRVFRRDPGAPAFSQIATVEKPSYDDAVDFGKEYSYYVQALDNAAESDNSATVTFKPKDEFPPAVPSGLTFILGGKSIELAWTHNTESDLAGYRIYRAFENNSFERITETRDSTSYSDRNIESGKHYRYAVTAIDRTGNESKLSEPVIVAAP